MLVLKPSCPDEALALALKELESNHIHTNSRNGAVLRFPTPVTTVWSQPANRIMWSANRDCNPMFHYAEAFWMLAGRNDVATVAKLSPNMLNYSDNQETLWGAYGFRWREHFGIDQISLIIDELKSNPTSRRCVLQMWDGQYFVGTSDLQNSDLIVATSGGKDVPCNTSIYFDPQDGVLNMTVCNRSNDMVFGAYGANVVHMSILHEYVAAQIGMQLGTYYQISNNLHLYLDVPVTSRLVSYADSKLKRNSDEVMDFNICVKKQEHLFSDLYSNALSDSGFVYQTNNMLDQFVKGDVVSSDLVQPRSLMILEAILNGFTLYKMQDTRSGASYLQERNNDLHSVWIENSIEWLKRRPSYESN